MRIGLVPISAKPYHRGHHELVELAVAQNEKVLLFVSISDRIRPNEFPISGTAMHEVWKEEIEQTLPSSVVVNYGGSPVRKVYEVIEEACKIKSNDIFTVYSDPEDTKSNYNMQNRQKYMAPLCNVGQVIFAAENDPDSVTRGVGTSDIHGADLRQALQDRDLNRLETLLPTNVNAQRVYDILSKAAGVTEMPRLSEIFFGGRF